MFKQKFITTLSILLLFVFYSFPSNISAQDNSFTKIAPANNAGVPQGQTTFSWTRPSNSIYNQYIIEFYDEHNQTRVYVDYVTNIATTSKTIDLSTVSSNFTRGTIYQWQVFASNGGNSQIIADNNSNWAFQIAPSPTPTPTPNPTCACKSDNTCDASCSFDTYSDITYSSPIKCSLSSNIFSSVPTQDNKNNWCKATKRTKGDGDGQNNVTQVDYDYYVQVVVGGKIPPSVNPDFDGDGVVGNSDRDIIVRTLHRQNSPYSCLQSTIDLNNVVSISIGGTNKVTIEDTLKQLSASCTTGTLVAGTSNKPIDFFPLQGCWGNPPANYHDILNQQQQQINQLKQTNEVIEMTCNPTGAMIQ